MKKFKWVVEIEIDETWVMDGFDILEDNTIAEFIRDHWLKHAYEWEVKTKIIKEPSRAAIRKSQSGK